MPLHNQVPISILPIANGVGGNPPIPSSLDYIPLIVFDPNKVGGPGYRTARATITNLVVAQFNPRLSPRIYTAAGGLAVVDPNESFLAINQTVPNAVTVLFPLAINKNGDCVIKDAKGDSDVHNITITFTGGELCDGLSAVVIATPFDEMRLTPKPGGGGYYLGK